MTSKPILLVEDNPQDEFLTVRALQRANVNCTIDVVRDGQQALDYLFGEGEFGDRRAEALPAVVLLDIGLPRISGLDVLQRLRADERTRLLPIVLLTSSNIDTDRLRGYATGCNSFICKPVQFDEFSAVVARLGVYWLTTNLPPPAEC